MQLPLPAFSSCFPHSFPPFFSPFFISFLLPSFYPPLFLFYPLPNALGSFLSHTHFSIFISAFLPHISLFSHTPVSLPLTYTHVLTKSQRLKHTEDSTFLPFISSGSRWLFPEFWAAHVGDWGCSGCRFGPLYLFQQQIILHLQIRWNFYRCVIF